MDNYIGPYWSDGQFQSSVAYGRLRPRNRIDYAARYHDTAYALYKDKRHRRAADKVFHDAVSREGRIGETLGDAVWFGNMSLFDDTFDLQDMADINMIPVNDPYWDSTLMFGEGYNPYLNLKVHDAPAQAPLIKNGPVTSTAGDTLPKGTTVSAESFGNPLETPWVRAKPGTDVIPLKPGAADVYIPPVEATQQASSNDLLFPKVVGFSDPDGYIKNYPSTIDMSRYDPYSLGIGR